MTESSFGPWPMGSQDAIGQAGEFLVWAALITQSGGSLHVFLPVVDRGIDGLIHRLHDRAYLAVQVKTKSVFNTGEAPIAVLESHLYTDDQLVIGAHLDGDRLGDYALVCDAADFKRKAARMLDRGRPMLVADIPLRPDGRHKWSEDLTLTSELAMRLGARPAERLVPPIPAPPDVDRVIGGGGETEVVRRLSFLENCGLFRPFPDNEMAEVVVRMLPSGRTIGLQVKTAQIDEPHVSRHVLINRSNFVPDHTTFVVALAWMLPEKRFHETCLLIPTETLPSIAGTSGPYYELHFRPDGSSEPSRVDPYRIPLESLDREIARRLGG